LAQDQDQQNQRESDLDRGMKRGAIDGPPDRHDVAELHAPIVREKTEPRDGYEPVPLWLVGLFGVLIFWGGWYVAQFSGGWRADVLDPHPEARFAGAAAREEAPMDPVELGGRLYRVNCESCHQSDGRGVSGQYPPLAGSSWVNGEPYRLKRILLNGLEGPIEVEGTTYNGNMPAFGDRLDDAKIAALLTYLRQAWGNEAEPLTAESVAATRAAVQDRRQPWTADELLAITEPDFTASPEASSETTSAEPETPEEPEEAKSAADHAEDPPEAPPP
jgi:mono/diheme cytochrome c family protein